MFLNLTTPEAFEAATRQLSPSEMASLRPNCRREEVEPLPFNQLTEDRSKATGAYISQATIAGFSRYTRLVAKS